MTQTRFVHMLRNYSSATESGEACEASSIMELQLYAEETSETQAASAQTSDPKCFRSD